MAMRTASPWWASLVFGVGVAIIFFGERLFGYLPSGRTILTVIGVLAVLAMTGLRAVTTLRLTDAPHPLCTLRPSKWGCRCCDPRASRACRRRTCGS